MDETHRGRKDSLAGVALPDSERGIPQLHQPGHRDQLGRRTPPAHDPDKQRSRNGPCAYISHLRSEAAHLEESVDELITIARRAGAPAEIYHLTAAGAANWPKMDAVIGSIASARAAGLRITADMYPYTAGSTGLAATMPQLPANEHIGDLLPGTWVGRPAALVL